MPLTSYSEPQEERLNIEAQENRQVLNQLDQCDMNISELENNIGRLFERIQPVFNGSKVNDLTDSDPIPDMSPVATRINGYTERILRLSQVVNAIERGLEV